MKNHLIQIPLERVSPHVLLRTAKCGVIAMLAAMAGLNPNIATGQTNEAGNDAEGAQVLTRGPVHEAFAGIVSFNPEAGVIVAKAPPELIEELPPEERPEGGNITWIPGYWAWDDERSDFLWISGTWRALPPGRQWITGYWTTTTEGNQWISGYWADSSVEETTYLPKPPATVEEGPNIAAPSPDYGWTPGYWSWQQERYAWSAGYWAQGRSNWEWIPAHYVWTPRGYIFVDGYWDYAVSRRGVLYAPVYLNSNLYSQRGYRYSPAIAIDLVSLIEHWFVRPRYHHYYFGDYYAPRYQERGFYSSVAYQSNRYGYDPVYSHRRWEHRQDRDWERRVEESYQYRRDHESARPPQTWAAQRVFHGDAAEQQQHRLMMAAPLDQLAKRKDGSIRIQKVPAQERRMLEQRGQDVRKSRDQRRTLEVMDPATARQPQEFKPTKVKAQRSPIVGKQASGFANKQAPPKPQRASVHKNKEKNQVRPKPQSTNRQLELKKPKQEPRKPAIQNEQSKPGKNQTAPRKEAQPPDSKRRKMEPQDKPQTKLQPEIRKSGPQKEQPKQQAHKAVPRLQKETPAPTRKVEQPRKIARQEQRQEPRQQQAQQPKKSESVKPLPEAKSKAKSIDKRNPKEEKPTGDKDRTQEQKDAEKSLGTNHRRGPR